jgi:hypothetical protein
MNGCTNVCLTFATTSTIIILIVTKSNLKNLIILYLKEKNKETNSNHKEGN